MWKTKRFWVMLLAGFIGTAAFDELTGWSFFSDLFFSGLMFLIGASLIQKFARPENRKTYLIFCVITCLLFGLEELSDLLEDLGGYVVVAWFGLIIINQCWKPKPLTVDEVKSKVRAVDGQLKRLNRYLEEGRVTDFQQGANQVLPELETIKSHLQSIKKELKPATYQRLIKRVDSETNRLRQQLTQSQTNQIDINWQAKVERLAPELTTTLTSIERDSLTILEKIQTATSGNQAELLQLHQTQMTRFYSILEGYLKIKEAPKNYYDADKRLATAKQAMESFNLELDEQLRQLNENDMHDFEVNLRLMVNNK